MKRKGLTWTQLEKIKVPMIVTSPKMWIFSSTFDSLSLEAAVSSSAKLGIHWLVQPRKSNTKYRVLSREAVGTIFIVSGMTRLGIQHMAYTPPRDHWVTQSTSVKVLSHPGHLHVQGLSWGTWTCSCDLQARKTKSQDHKNQSSCSKLKTYTLCNSESPIRFQGKPVPPQIAVFHR